MNSDGKITLAVNLSASDLERAPLHRLVSFARILSVLLCVFVLYETATLLPVWRDYPGSLATMWASAALGSLFAFFFPRLRARSVFRNTPALQGPRTYEFSADGIRSSGNGSSAQHAWSALHKDVQTRSLF